MELQAREVCKYAAVQQDADETDFLLRFSGSECPDVDHVADEVIGPFPSSVMDVGLCHRRHFGCTRVELVVASVLAVMVVTGIAMRNSQAPLQPKRGIRNGNALVGFAAEDSVLTKASSLCGCVAPVPTAECPSIMVAAGLGSCDSVDLGRLCDGDGECGTRDTLDNCGRYDVYRKVGKTPCEGAKGDKGPDNTQDFSVKSTFASLILGNKNRTRKHCGCLKAISTSECPSIMTVAGLGRCDTIGVGWLCDGDGECSTDKDLNNCRNYDVYRMVNNTACI